MLDQQAQGADRERSDPDARAWGLELGAGDDALVGPLSAFHLRSATSIVTVVSPDTIPTGRPVQQGEITEWKGTSAIDYFAFDGYDGLFHHGGGNWILWNHNLTQFFITDGTSWPATWVHVRFVLRHLIVAGLLARPGHHCIHAVVAETASDGGRRGLLVAGPTGSGKTRLVNRLVERGVVSGVVEDDCAVVDAAWTLTSLIPTEHELRRPRRLPITAVALLDAGTTDGPTSVSARAVADFAATCPTPWPARWLPGATPRSPRMGDLPSALRAVRIPVRSDTDESVLDAVASLLDE